MRPMGDELMKLLTLLRRYGLLFGVQIRASLLLAMQYRADFFLHLVLSVAWAVASLVPLFVLYQQRPSVAGWRWAEALLVVGWFSVLKGLLDGAIQPSLQNIVDHLRKGTLDFLLLKPADAQFLLSTSRLEIWNAVDAFAGVLVLGYALHQIGHVPSFSAIIATFVVLSAAALILYSIWILVISLAFYVVKVDNLSYLFAAIFDAARWPSSIFRGAIAFIFTFIIPLAVMTTFPALSLLDRLAWSQAGAAIGGALVFSIVARRIWQRAIKHYTSAGG